jgi:hypothetical protein
MDNMPIWKSSRAGRRGDHRLQGQPIWNRSRAKCDDLTAFMRSPLDILSKYGLNPPEDYAWFDCENFDEGEAYLSLFNWLIAITRGEFDPQNVKLKAGFTGNKTFIYVTEIEFDIGDTRETILLSCGWFDKDLITELNAIAGKLGLSKKFYGIKTGDQSLIIVFIDQSQKERLEAEDILDNFDDSKRKPKGLHDLKIVDCRWRHP